MGLPAHHRTPFQAHRERAASLEQRQDILLGISYHPRGCRAPVHRCGRVADDSAEPGPAPSRPTPGAK
eukprot:14915157-Heterocapsa_arctica.AAC.1